MIYDPKSLLQVWRATRMSNFIQKFENISSVNPEKPLKPSGPKYKYILTGNNGIKWTVDSGATVHCVNDKSLITPYANQEPIRLQMANKHIIKCTYVGDVTLKVLDDHGTIQEMVLHNVCYHPSFSSNLLSVRRLRIDNHMKTVFDDENYFECKRSSFRVRFEDKHGYRLTTVLSASVVLDYNLLHARFGHTSSKRLKLMKDRAHNFPNCHNLEAEHDPTECDHCLAGKMKRKPFPKRQSQKFTYFGERLSSDLCGPFPKSVHGFKYALVIVDSFTNYMSVYPLKSKASLEVKESLHHFITAHKHLLPDDSSGRSIRWHTDNGGEFTSADIDEFCQEFAIHRSFSVPFAPPQNAHAERMWGILLSTVRTMLSQSKLPDRHWTYAILHACDLHNMLPSSKLHANISPHQALFNEKPDVGRIRTFGCIAWYRLEDHERKSKVSPVAVPAIHLGCDDTRKGYIIWVPYLNRITTAFHLTFQETKFMSPDLTLPTISPLRPYEYHYKEPRDIRSKVRRQKSSKTPDAHHDTPNEGHNDDEHDGNHDDDMPEPVQGEPMTDRDDDDQPPLGERCHHPDCTLPKHSRDEPHSFERFASRQHGRNAPRSSRMSNPNYVSVVIDDVDNDLITFPVNSVVAGIPIPDTYDQAMSSNEKAQWRASMEKELTDLMKHETWETVDRLDVPRGRKVTKSRWCYTIKLNRDGTIERFKSRFVVCGYSQVQGKDYTEAFSATLRATSFRTLLATAAGEKLRLEHFDVTNAFTQSEIDATIFVEPPKGFDQEKGRDGRAKVLKLKKSLYGTKQASRLWQEKLAGKLVSLGFSRSKTDPCLFSRRDKQKGSVILIGVYVDDIIVAHNGVDFAWFTQEFTGPQGFRSKHIGSLSWYLGMSIDQEPDFSISISQEQYVKKLLEKFIPNFSSGSIKHNMPCNPDTFLKITTAANDHERSQMKDKPYLQIIGSLLYLSTMTRPDIAYHMSVLCSFMHDPSLAAYAAALDLLQYIGNSIHQKLTFSGSMQIPMGVDKVHHSQILKNHGLLAYSDASWRDTGVDGYNRFGYIVYFMGGPISFNSKQIKVVALSSAEAEYAAAAYTCKEIAYVRNILSDLGVRLDGPTKLAVDNQAAIKISINSGVTGRNKHFKDAIHYFRDCYVYRMIDPFYVKTAHQHADGFTKPLGITMFRAWAKRFSSGPHWDVKAEEPAAVKTGVNK